jgi:two-component system, chemotaxis family, response regulator Rcp1
MTAEMLHNKQRPTQILLVEDSRGDVVLAKRAFADSKLACEIAVAMSGEDALARLQRAGEFIDAVLPDLILLDLNLPRMSGQDVLSFIKTSPQLKHIPVMVLSSSRAEPDVVKSYQLHANAYVVKPTSLEKFRELVTKLEQFWFTLAIVPDPTDIPNGG